MNLLRILQNAVVVSVVACLVGCPSFSKGGSSSRDSASAPAASDPVPASPTGLVCTANVQDVYLSWENPASYSEIRITRDGALVSTLAGTAVSYSETVGTVATFSYGVTGVDEEGFASAAAACSVTTAALPSVRSLACAFDAYANEVRLTWALPSGQEYDALHVYRNNVSIAQLGGTAVSYTDASPAAASYQYQVRGTFDGQVSGSASCSVQVRALAQISALAWSVDTSNGDVVLSWSNGQSYDQIVVACGGEVVVALDGATTQYRYSHVPYGVYEFTVQATYGARETAVVSCAGNVGRLVWDQDTTGCVTGYHVYVWADGESTPAVESPSLSVGRVTTTPLLELLSAGALPTTRDPATYNIALAAFDAYGNTSELSTSVLFSWQVLSASNAP